MPLIRNCHRIPVKGRLNLNVFGKRPSRALTISKGQGVWRIADVLREVSHFEVPEVQCKRLSRNRIKRHEQSDTMTVATYDERSDVCMPHYGIFLCRGFVHEFDKLESLCHASRGGGGFEEENGQVERHVHNVHPNHGGELHEHGLFQGLLIDFFSLIRVMMLVRVLSRQSRVQRLLDHFESLLICEVLHLVGSRLAAFCGGIVGRRWSRGRSESEPFSPSRHGLSFERLSQWKMPTIEARWFHEMFLNIFL
mmetsp:Transcript_6195/g.11198  ORF Transcript_6195/g.11198 Transcript_6195/m.11198 type:complete len:252 (-) Transcript_6195:953-1708(-)